MSERDDEFAGARWGTKPPSVTAPLWGVGGWSPPLPPPPPPPLGAPPRTPRRRGFVGLAIVVALLLLLGGALVGWLRGGHTETGKGSRTNSVDATRRLSAGIVDIQTFTYGSGGIGGSQVPLGAGTGMVLTSSGEVLTNNHVIRGATSIQVTIPGRSGKFSATVLGADPTADVALIKIDAVSGLPTESFGDSSMISVGARVTALGNALGRGGAPSVTRGTVSALGRSISVRDDQGGVEHLSGLLQMSAAISPGESGGAVVDDAGQVIGMITAAASRGPQQPVSNIGFAIPANAALEVAHQIQSGQASADAYISPTGFLGVENLHAERGSRFEGRGRPSLWGARRRHRERLTCRADRHFRGQRHHGDRRKADQVARGPRPGDPIARIGGFDQGDVGRFERFPHREREPHLGPGHLEPARFAGVNDVWNGGGAAGRVPSQMMLFGLSPRSKARQAPRPSWMRTTSRPFSPVPARARSWLWRPAGPCRRRSRTLEPSGSSTSSNRDEPLGRPKVSSSLPLSL